MGGRDRGTGVRGNGGRNDPLFNIRFNDYTILAQLFLHQDHLLPSRYQLSSAPPTPWQRDRKGSNEAPTFSVPLTTKYPPGSNGHSPIVAISSAPLPLRLHRSLFNMIGRRPIMTPLRRITFLSLTYSISTLSGAEYVLSRNRHSIGVIEASPCPASWSDRVGRPTWISV